MIEGINDFKKYKKEEVNKEQPFVHFLLNTAIKTLIVIVLFLGSLIYIRQSDKNKELFEKIVYQNSLSFAKIYNVYEKYLGDAIPFKNTYKNSVKKVSSEKITYESIEKKDNGYILAVSNNYTVPSITSGIVIEKKNNMIKVQDKNGLEITYDYVSDINVKLYDYIEKGEIIGVSNGKLYLEFIKDDNYLSYEKYL